MFCVIQQFLESLKQYLICLNRFGSLLICLPRPIHQEIVITQSFKNEGASRPSPAIAASNAAVSNAVVPENGFTKLGLSAELLRAVAEQGYTQPTPIQAQAIPVVLSGRDLLGAAQTGTGKTAGFTLPMLYRLAAKPDLSNARRPVRALILTPTRELCAQVQESVKTYGRYMKMTSTTIYGGVGFHPQVTALRRGVDIVVATPGRLLDHVQQRTIDLRGIEMLVLDEADRMLDMGFIHDIRRIVTLLPKERQTLLFSATFSDEIRQLAAAFQRDPATIEVARRNAPIELVTQVVHPVDKDKKRELLAHLVKTQNWQQVLVFTKTKHGANRLAEQLERDGIQSDAIHGNKSQPQRMRALKRFKDLQVQVLVATDIAARGIDIDALPHVVNFDLPNVAEDYVHRIGRTGRAGSTGDAVSLVCGEDRPLLNAIERLTGKQIEQRIIAGFEPTQPFRSSERRKPAQRQPAKHRPSTHHTKPQPGKSADRGNWQKPSGAPARRDRPMTSWETEREAQRKHFGSGQKTDSRGSKPSGAPSALTRKAA